MLGIPSSLERIALARGNLDRIDCEPDAVALEGWLLHPRQEITSLRLYLNGALAGTADLTERPDVGRAFPWIPHASRSGVSVRVRRPGSPGGDAGRIDLVGCRDEQPVVRLSTLYRADLDTAFPTPPPELTYRVTHTRDGRGFKAWGLKCYGDLLELIRRHRDPVQVRRLLDWGCGCGRLTAHFLADFRGAEVHGCDVDAEAVAWCNAHLAAGRFRPIDPFPPTPYPEAHFDLIIGYSIFTHLTREVQAAWLAELRRLLAPGGLAVVTVHGESATAFAFPGNAREVLRDGIFDGAHDGSLGGIVPQGYYRGTYQSQEHTVGEWGKVLDVLDYRVRGTGNHQDAVVLRRAA
jgi:SAM-dependent methyltransferase